jgi:uncharacterized membrane protein YqjE
VQGHITTWILSLFAATEQVADVGALARLGIVFTFLGLPLAQLVLPRIARTQEPRRLLRLCMLALGGILLASLALAGLGVLFADQVLWLLGTQYAHLHLELAFFLGSLVLGTVANAAWGLCYTRNWVRHAWLQIPLAVVVQALSAFQSHRPVDCRLSRRPRLEGHPADRERSQCLNTHHDSSSTHLTNSPQHRTVAQEKSSAGTNLDRSNHQSD